MILIFGILACAVRSSDVPEAQTFVTWEHDLISDEFAHPGHTPALLTNAVIWRPFESDTLVYQSLSGNRSAITYDWLRGTPVQWAAAEHPEYFVLAWIDSRDGLWVARLKANGEQDTAPIVIAEDNMIDFRLIALPGGETLLIYLVNDILQYTILDPEGRPFLPVTLQSNVQHFSAAMRDDFRVWLVWQSGSTFFAGMTDLVTGQIIENRVLQEEIPSELTDLEFVIAESQFFAIYSTRSEDAPDIEQLSGITFSQATEAEPFKMMLPNDPPLRWLSAQEQQLALTAWIEGQWQPVLIQFDRDGIVEVTVLDGLPVNGGAVTAKANTRMAWITLDDQLMPRLVVMTQKEETADVQHPVWQTAIRQGLQVSYLGIVWLIAPLVSFYRSRDQWYILPAFLFSYWLGKIVLDFGLFDQKPAALNEFDVPPFILTASALLVITMAAAGIATVGWRHGPRMFRYTTYCLTDLLLTFAIFGGDVQFARLFGGR